MKTILITAIVCITCFLANCSWRLDVPICEDTPVSLNNENRFFIIVNTGFIAPINECSCNPPETVQYCYFSYKIYHPDTFSDGRILPIGEKVELVKLTYSATKTKLDPFIWNVFHSYKAIFKTERGEVFCGCGPEFEFYESFSHAILNTDKERMEGFIKVVAATGLKPSEPTSKAR